MDARREFASRSVNVRRNPVLGGSLCERGQKSDGQLQLHLRKEPTPNGTSAAYLVAPALKAAVKLIEPIILKSCGFLLSSGCQL